MVPGLPVIRCYRDGGTNNRARRVIRPVVVGEIAKF